MTQRYPGGFVTKTPPTLNPALGNSTPGVWTLDQVMQNIKAGTWPAYDPYFEYTTLLLHGNGTNGAQNNTFLDSSTNNFTITRNGNTTQGTFTPYGSNWSNYFDTSQYINAGANSAYALGSSDWTMEMWVYITAIPSAIDVLGNWAGTAVYTNSQFIWRINSNGTHSFYYFATSTGSQTSVTTGAPSGSLSTNRWYHFVLTKSGTTLTPFQDGVAGSTATVSTSTLYGTATSTALSAGVNNGGGNTNNAGYVSNVRLTIGQVLYTSNFTPSTSPLTTTSQGATAGNVKLLTCQSNRFIDNSSNAFAITVTGSPSVQRFSPFNPTTPYAAGTIGGSGYFDGSGDYLSVADNAAFDFGSGDFTIECWAYTDTFASQYNVLVCQWNTSYSFIFRITSSLVGLYINVGNPYTLQDYSASVTNTTGQWDHFCVTRSGSTLTFYKNGASIGTSSISATITNAASDLTVGVLGDLNSTTYHKGYISGMRLIKGTAVAPTITTPPTAVSGTSLLLNMTNGGIIDNAMMNDLETVGNAQISTSVSKFGGGSLAFDGTGDFLKSPNTPQSDLSSGDFTIEFWFNTNTLTPSGGISPGYACIVGRQNWNGSSGAGWGVWQFNQTIMFFWQGIAGSFATGNVITSTGTWYHVAVVRSGTASNNTKIYINGVQQGQGTPTITSSTQPLTVGGTDTTVAWDSNYYINGYIDDLRITKGYARYTANFTPQTSQWQDQ